MEIYQPTLQDNSQQTLIVKLHSKTVLTFLQQFFMLNLNIAESSIAFSVKLSHYFELYHWLYIEVIKLDDKIPT